MVWYGMVYSCIHVRAPRPLFHGSVIYRLALSIEQDKTTEQNNKNNHNLI